MTMWGVPFKTAIGTSAAIGFVVAVSGTIGYVAAGFTEAALPAWAFGYVYLPALLGISVTSAFMAPVGARLAHRLPVAALKKAFALFLLALAVKLFTSL
jgi:uncharacterized membrane protein YfcA